MNNSCLSLRRSRGVFGLVALASAATLWLAFSSTGITAAPLPATGNSTAATTPAPAVPLGPDAQAVAAAYQAWLKGVASSNGDPAPMIKFYAPDAILVATYSPGLRHAEKNELAEYFKKFTALPDITGTTQDLQTRVYGDFAINTGLYTFTFNTADSGKVTVPARFTFVYRKVGDQWLIVDHHSSLVPDSL